jgi:hypothetical protein
VKRRLAASCINNESRNENEEMSVKWLAYRRGGAINGVMAKIMANDVAWRKKAILSMSVMASMKWRESWQYVGG